MCKLIKRNWFPLSGCLLTLLSALFWVALRINHSGISKFLGADINPSFLVMNLPVMVCVLGWIGFLLAFLGLVFWKKTTWPSIAGFVIGCIMTVGALAVIYFGAWDYLDFILVHYIRSLWVSAGLIGLALLLFFPAANNTRWVTGCKWAVLLLAVLCAVVFGYQLRPCDFTYGAVVYAVEDDYQIVFSTSDSAAAWVTIDGQAYYDLYAGSMRSKDLVHKVTVSQAVLDKAGSYSIHAQQMIYRGPFGGYKGPEIFQNYEFRPADASDGLYYVSLSDVHGAADAAAKAAQSPELDFLVLLGDLVSMVETEKDAQFANRLAHAVTKGQIPVIYARGNHEIKGEYAEDLYKYVGSLNQGFAYTVTLSDTVFAAVLDMGEDHEDDWWEYYGTAKFDLYRDRQTQMLESILSDGDYESYRYRMAICHIPIPYIDEYGYFAAYRLAWTELLNQMGTDISLSGHEHRVWYFLPDTLEAGVPLLFSQRYAGEPEKPAVGTVTDFRFPTFLCGQRSLTQQGGTQKLGLTDYLCLHTSADLSAGIQTGTYRSSLGQTVAMEYPFAWEGDLNQQGLTDIITSLR